MGTRQYIGARYVPKFFENANNTSEWVSGVAYEPLTIVTYNGNSYTSKKTVPANIGNPSANPTYWASTGIYSAQVEEVRQEVEEVKAELLQTEKTVTQRRFVFIGDSYLEGYTSDGYVTSWGTRIAQILNLDSSQYTMQYMGGAGFVSTGNGKNFIDLLNDSVMTDPETVTDIIVNGGANDYSQSGNNVKTAMASFKTLAHTKYPHAKIWCGHCGWMQDGAKIYQFATSVRDYIEGAEINGFVYIKNSEMCLHRYNSVFASDHLHPNAAGQEFIAKNVIDVILGGSGSNYGAYQSIGFTVANEGDSSTLGQTAVTMNDRMVTVMGGNQMNYTFATPIATYSATGANLIDLGTITGASYVYGCSYNVLAIPVHVVARDGSGFHSCDGVLIIKDGHIYLTLKMLAANGGWGSFTNLTYLEFGRFCCTFDGLMC